MIEVQHECDRCRNTMGRKDTCLCSSCTEDDNKKLYDEAFEAGKKEGIEESNDNHTII